VTGRPIATGPDALAVIDFANGLIGDLSPEQRPAAFGAFVTAFRLGAALALIDPAWARTVDAELAAGMAEDREEQRRQVAWALAQIRCRAAAHRCRSGPTPPARPNRAAHLRPGAPPDRHPLNAG
jgi:hypothetical protein